MFETFYFSFVECCVGINNKGTKGRPKKIKIMKDANNNELVLS
jgi:hypothetical protein